MFKFALVLIIAPLVLCHHHHDHHEHNSNHSHHDHSEGGKTQQHHSRHGSPVDLTIFNGTEIHAPFHCHQSGWKVNEIPLSNLITLGCLVDVSEKSKNNPDFQLLPEHLEEWEKNNGKFRNNTVLLINFGWSSKYSTPEYFANHPGISEKAAEYIVNSNVIVGVAVDTPDVDSSTDKPSLHTLHGSNIYTVEKLTFKAELLKHFYIVIVPLEYDKNADAHVRVIAV